MLHVYVYTCTHAYVEFHVYACVDWYGLEMVCTYVDATMAGARQNMRVRIPSIYMYSYMDGTSTRVLVLLYI